MDTKARSKLSRTASSGHGSKKPSKASHALTVSTKKASGWLDDDDVDSHGSARRPTSAGSSRSGSSMSAVGGALGKTLKQARSFSFFNRRKSKTGNGDVDSLADGFVDEPRSGSGLWDRGTPRGSNRSAPGRAGSGTGTARSTERSGGSSRSLLSAQEQRSLNRKSAKCLGLTVDGELAPAANRRKRISMRRHSAYPFTK